MSNLSELAHSTIDVTFDGDHDRFAHYVEKEEITYALVHGVPVIALCGKVWVPSRAPDKYPVCKTCSDILDGLFVDGNGQV